MNRRQLFKGAIGVIGAALLPAMALGVPCKWHPEGCIGDKCAGKQQTGAVNPSPFLPNHMTLEQHDRVVDLYGLSGQYASVGDDYAVGYDNRIYLMDGNVLRTHTKPVILREDHMFLDRQMFHGKSWEEAIVYAETYKRWLEFHGDEDGKWLQETIRHNPWQGQFFYANEVDMRGVVDDLGLMRYNL